MPNRTAFATYNFALVICRNPKDGKFLAVEETKNRGWWIPGGGVDAGESFRQAAHRECLEEAGVKIELKGILRIDHHLYGASEGKMRVIFYAEPVDPDCTPKQVADSESLRAEWVTMHEFAEKDKIRGYELIEYGEYLKDGGIVAPMSMLKE